MENTTTRPQIEAYRFTANGDIPNNPTLPLLVYRGALPLEGDAAAACETRFTRHGWRAAWRDGVFGYDHYHTTAHEALGVVSGEARVRFGGSTGRTLTLRKGDVVVIPAGVAHKNEGASRDFLVVGAYPEGQDWDLCPAKPNEQGCACHNIEDVPLPASDPVYGADGPLIAHWRA